MMQSLLQFDRQQIVFPDDTQRLVIVGTTGSGKTHAALWHLCRRNYDVKPWIVYDFKGDDFIQSIPGTFALDVHASPPEHPGIYIVNPIPDEDDEAVSDQMTEIWKATDIGVFVDEGYMIARSNKGFRRLLVQGRSKHIPMIVCSQRPVWMDRFVFTESEFKQVFRLQSSDDMKKMQDEIPHKMERLEKRWSWYYNGPDDDLRRLRPVPDQDAIRRIFDMKLSRLRKVI